ncbi:MAG: nucleotide pyrophosphohydrolase [Proteobacteria bacterium]|jgi:dCTP diphosphatase|nr:nucleotide pyrophosphohydrolase [Pseudomonadota bacterium]MDA0926461.1 nucleotide pyrophosphohydrolase [Pseudomonadota bacterium]
MPNTNVELLRRQLADFVRERDWSQFHSPKNLSMALSVEAAELLEIFQWQTEQQSSDLDEETQSRVAEELADILLYTLLLSDRLGIDLVSAAQAKLQSNARKYPAEKVRGSSRKYTDY